MSNSHIIKQLGKEYISADEDSITAAMVREMEDQVKRMFEDRKMLRQVHTKMHGCVKAEFIVEPDLPKELRVGVFGESKSYHAWVRFSNGNTEPQADKKKDIRGIAIKLLGVPGEKLLNDESDEPTQDFLLMSSETFFSRNTKEFSKTLKSITSKNPLAKFFYFLNPFHLKMLMRVKKSMVPCLNPLDLAYWSTQPYQFGSTDKAVKYFLKPAEDNKTVVANTKDDDYLRVNLAQTLNNHIANFDFYVQFQTNADTMPIEDPTVVWTSQFIKLARLKIYPQSFDTTEQMEFGENLSFNPWHSLPAHRPLGSFNRTRKKAYEALSKLRHHRNKLPMKEPLDTSDFLRSVHKIHPSNTIDQAIPKKGIIMTSAEVKIDCDKKTAYEYILSVKELPNWLTKKGPIYGIKKVSLEGKHYDRVGDKRLIERGDDATLVEELISCNPFANYAYQITDFSDFFRHLTAKGYGRFWFDTEKDQTRVRWEYSFTYKNILGRLFLSLFVPLVLKKYLQNGLNNVKSNIEEVD